MNMRTTIGRELSCREIEVVGWLAEGKSAAEIAIILQLSRWTVKSHIANSMAALGVHKDTALVRQAMRKGLIE